MGTEMWWRWASNRNSVTLRKRYSLREEDGKGSFRPKLFRYVLLFFQLFL